MIKTIEGNTSSTKGLVANGGCVAQKQYVDNYSKIQVILRPKYKSPAEARAVISKAKEWEGYCEKKSNSQLENKTANAGYNNYTIFAQRCREKTKSAVYANPGKWCDYFVDFCFIEALGTARAKELLGSWTGYTPDSAKFLKQAGATVVKASEAKYGDVIFFRNSERICHTGLVTNGYAEKAADDERFVYSAQSLRADMMSATGTKTPENALLKTKTLSEKKNPTDIQVLIVQKRLKALGYYEGTPDREFGPLTTKAVNKYQKEILKYNTCDGEITKKAKMWKSLLGLV